jgi:hypothetical protein
MMQASLFLMIIGDFNVIGAVFPPFKADSVLVVDANAVLALTIARKLLQPEARHRKVAEVPG